MIDQRPPDESDEMPEPAPKGTTSIPVAGIGGSAGGLEVFKHLLADLPADTGLAIVFVQHLDPKHHSLLREILARATAMPVSEAADGMPVEANHVYVIPANSDLSIAQGVLHLAPRTQDTGPHMPIDRFLRSLAEECGSQSIGVILSGAGTDGAAGIQAIKAAGGVTFAQDQYTAKFASMPQAAVATNCVDFVLPPERIAAELVRIGHHPYVADASVAEQAPVQDGDEAAFLAILGSVHGVTGVDFSLYREKTIRRRILRRLALRNIDTLAAYASRLNDDPDELTALQRDLLISVTSFFRDPGSFDSLKNLVYPRILQGRPAHAPIRVWVPGCATGEEAFSIAISISEYLSQSGLSFAVQIFGSDISEQSIEKARGGRYLENIAADMSAERLNRYFVKTENGYQIHKNLREMCVFTRHNLLTDPPFSKLDLVSCRNVLIYLSSVQKNIIPLFHYSLRPNGFLMLGQSETAAFPELFSLVDPEHRIYARREVARKPYPFRSGSGAAFGGGQAEKKAAEPPPELWNVADVRQEVDRVLLSRYSLAAVVVDQDLEVLEIRGKASTFLSLPAGKVSFNLLKLIPQTSLFLEVEKLVHQVQHSGESARQERIPFDSAGYSGEVSVEVVPLRARQENTLLILFEPAPAASQAEPAAEPLPAGAPEDLKDRQIARLKQELEAAKQRFLAVLEEHQISREESQNSTEEALSTNEELQSLNEELETAKEELQSTNEELITVNDELQANNLALAKARDFAMSIVETVRQPLLVLDMDLRIKMANRAFYRLFKVSPQEAEGRLVYSLSDGSWDIPVLREELEVLVHGGISFPGFETEREFPVVGRRFLVLGGGRIEHLKMILLAVEDVSERKHSEEALLRSQEHLRQAQKMEAIGRLAGGIAHDFNNLLTAIIGYSALLLDSLAGNEAAHQQVLQIRLAGDRAAALTRQLLAFSRRQVLQPKVMDLNLIVTDFDRLLRRLVGERIDVAIECAPELWQVCADPGEIGRAVMNLALNARDAMPGDGRLTIQTANVTLAAGAEALERGLPPGRYAMLAVGDTGVGMDAEMQEHIFEPFFTTKETGKGTGLGLATVLGIVEQSGGAIWCQSEVGEGTSFRILLPAVKEEVQPGVPQPTGLATAPRGTESILLVEDEDAVRELVRTILEARGYSVVEARNGREGLKLCQSHTGGIDLLVTDVVMPELGGRELAEGALKLRPALKVLFMSGHTQDVILKEGVQQGAAFLHKPFTPLQLAQKVRDTLDAR